MKKQKGVKIKYLEYLLNKKDKTACINGNFSVAGDVVIPSFINYESFDYPVTCIGGSAFKNTKKLRSIQFSINSPLQTIENNAFIHSSIESFFIPSILKEIKEKSFRGTPKLTKINIFHFMTINLF